MEPLTPTLTTTLSSRSSKYYHLSVSGSYQSKIPNFASSKFSLLHLNDIYAFPIIARQKYSPRNELLIKSDKVIHASEIDINNSIKRMCAGSPFKTDEFQDSMHLFGSIEEISREDYQISDSASLQEYQKNLSHPLENDSAFFTENSGRGFYSRERISVQADSACILSEGGAQTVPNFPEGISMKNPLTVSPLVQMSLIPQKLSASIIPTADLREQYKDDIFSPIAPKILICDGEGTNIVLQSAISAAGFIAMPYLQFSDSPDKNKATLLEYSVHLSLLSGQVIESIKNTSVSQISFGFEHAAILTVYGQIMTWGYGRSGCLGHNSTCSLVSPTLVQDLIDQHIVYLECGGYHTIAVDDDGGLYTWGRGDVNQIGIESSQLIKDDIGFYSPKPRQIDFFKDINVVSGACGEAHSIILDSDGRLYSFGWGEDGQLGVGRHCLNKAMISTRPNLLQGLLGVHVVRVKAGNLFSACLTDTGEVYAWGNGEQGQLGLGDTFLQSDFPVQLEGLEDVLDIQCGETHMLAVDSDGRIWGWGVGRALDFLNSAFPDGSEVVCYQPIALAEAEIALHIKLDDEFSQIERNNERSSQKSSQ